MRSAKLSFWLTVFSLLVFLPVAPAALAAGPATEAGPPETRRDPVVETLHGVRIIDPYRWLEDQQAPATREWIARQNAYTESLLGRVDGRQAIKQRLTELLRVDTIGVPRARNGRYFFEKREADQDLSVIYVREGLRGEDRVLVDPHPLSPDHTTSVDLVDVSQDGRLLVYAVREGGEDETRVRFLDVDAREHLPDELPRARYFLFGGGLLTPDKTGFYYSRHTEAGPRVFFHKMGTDPAEDKLLFGEGYDKSKIIVANLSDDGRFLVIHVLHGSAAPQTEIYYADRQKGTAIRPLVNDIEARFFGEPGGDTLFVQTNWKAPNNRVLAVNLRKPGRGPEAWREVVPESEAVIEGVSLAGGKLFVNYLQNVRSFLKVFEPDGSPAREIRFPALGTVSGMAGRWSSDESFYVFSSFHIPTTIYRYNVATAAQQVWARRDVPVDTEKLAVRQVWYQSKDKTLVPMFLVHRKGIALDGSNPTYLTGYGGFNVSLTPRFSATAVLWAERGGVFAMPNLRGGGELGEAWHRAGMLGNKQTVFDDFIAAAEWLIENGYTRPAKLAIAGGSNGGLLVGAAMTQRPALFGAVVCRYPLLDMLRYHNFLVARFWVPEYGSADDPEQFEYLLEYSPYHNVEEGADYPAVLFITGDADTRVDPLHARKMTARMQSATAGAEHDNDPVLLQYDTKAGHSGGKPLSKRIEDSTDTLLFLFWQLGLQDEME